MQPGQLELSQDAAIMGVKEQIKNYLTHLLLY